ncbi:MAG: DnaB-like helicase C-terminal domain-containing protein [Gemmataceae bacterium]
MNANIVKGTDFLGSWFSEVERGEPPIRYQIAEPFETLDVRPGRLILFGGAPGDGKTAALLQASIDLLRLNEFARLLIANVEMTPDLLMNRIVSRLASVPLRAIENRELNAEQLFKVKATVGGLQKVAERLAFLQAPYSLQHVADAGTVFDANVLLIDYVQRFSVGKDRMSERERLEAAAPMLRAFCDAGVVALVASAVTRQKGDSGSNYANLGLASFRGSSELEFGCDSAYLFAKDDSDKVTLQCGKNRHGAVVDIETRFEGSIQTFRPFVPADAHQAKAGLEGFDEVDPAVDRRKKSVRKQKCGR